MQSQRNCNQENGTHHETQDQNLANACQAKSKFNYTSQQGESIASQK
jgi:hypothetical protein